MRSRYGYASDRSFFLPAVSTQYPRAQKERFPHLHFRFAIRLKIIRAHSPLRSLICRRPSASVFHPLARFQCDLPYAQAVPVIIFSPCPSGTTGRPFPFPSKKRSFWETAKALASTSFLNETPARRVCSPNRRDLIQLGMTKGMEPHHRWTSTRPSKNARRA